jgi:riboflavin kinase/FMN adenylyltransferase
MPLEVFHSPQEWSRHFGPARRGTALTIGSFDGLHLGHQELLRGVAERARARKLIPAAVTFDPHPLKVLHPEKAPPMLATLEQRLRGFEQLGLDVALVLKFDRELSKVTAEEFVKIVLVEHLRLRVLRVGQNFRFGHRHAGDVKLLRSMGSELGFDVEIVEPIIVRRVVVSSTSVRQALTAGRVIDAARLLGRPFALTGQIQTGTGQGRRLVVPTLNLAPDQEVLPKPGVYVTESSVAGLRYPSVTNIGFRPTFDGHHLIVETHLFEFSAQVTSGPMEVHFLKRLRGEKKFAHPKALRAQVLLDLGRARAFFRRLSRAEIGALPRMLRNSSRRS